MFYSLLKLTLSSEKGVTHLLVLVAGVATLSFLIITNTFSFGSPLFSKLFPKPSSYAATDFLTIDGRMFKYQGQTVLLKGENFNQEGALTNYDDPNLNGDITKINVTEADYAALEAYGANHVRWGISWSWYSPKNATADKAKFFSVMDQHVAWAKKHHLWLIPLLFTLPDNCYEGYTKTCSNFWNSSSQQNEVRNFWIDVASHYKNEPIVAGYDILNEPTPPTKANQWYNLAQSIRDAIVSTDPNHFIIVESAPGTQSGYPFDATLGSKIVYSVHGYAPGSMTNCVSYPPCNYPYPGNAPDYDNTTHYWSKDSFAGNTADPRPDMKPRMAVDFSQANNVPLYIGEEGTENGYTGYQQMITDKFSLFDSWGVHWAHFVWRSRPGNFGIYPSTGALTTQDQLLLDAVKAQWAGAIKPTDATPSTSSSASPSPSPIPSLGSTPLPYQPQTQNTSQTSNQTVNITQSTPAKIALASPVVTSNQVSQIITSQGISSQPSPSFLNIPSGTTSASNTPVVTIKTLEHSSQSTVQTQGNSFPERITQLPILGDLLRSLSTANSNLVIVANQLFRGFHVIR